MYLAKITITLRKSILDPQGKAVHHALESLDMPGICDVRIGKFIELKIESVDEREAHRVAEQACRQLLRNPVMEDYTFTVERA